MTLAAVLDKVSAMPNGQQMIRAHPPGSIMGSVTARISLQSNATNAASSGQSDKVKLIDPLSKLIEAITENENTRKSMEKSISEVDAAREFVPVERNSSVVTSHRPLNSIGSYQNIHMSLVFYQLLLRSDCMKYRFQCLESSEKFAIIIKYKLSARLAY
jgi:hypothetical protein